MYLLFQTKSWPDSSFRLAPPFLSCQLVDPTDPKVGDDIEVRLSGVSEREQKKDEREARRRTHTKQRVEEREKRQAEEDSRRNRARAAVPG